MFSKKKPETFYYQNVAQLIEATEAKIKEFIEQYDKEYNLRLKSGIKSLKFSTAYLGAPLGLDPSLADYSIVALIHNIEFLEYYLVAVEKASIDITALDTVSKKINGEAGFEKKTVILARELKVPLSQILTLDVRDLVQNTADQVNELANNNSMFQTHNTL